LGSKINQLHDEKSPKPQFEGQKKIDLDDFLGLTRRLLLRDDGVWKCMMIAELYFSFWIFFQKKR